MPNYEKDFRVEDMGTKTVDQQTWRDFVDKFGAEGYLWLCHEVNGSKIHVPQYDGQLKPARLRAQSPVNRRFKRG